MQLTQLNEANAFFAQRQAEDKQARDALQAAFAALSDARSTYAQQEKESTAITSKLATLDDNLQSDQHGPGANPCPRNRNRR